jgi:hypothetical protein
MHNVLMGFRREVPLRMKKILITLLITAGAAIPVLAQRVTYASGEAAIGGRFGGASGLTFKKFTRTTFAIELVAVYSFDPELDEFGLTALFENHHPIISKRFSFLYGIGPAYVFRDHRLGGSGIVGFDWRVGKTPLNFQIDWMPSFFFINDVHFSPVNGALSIRYILNNRRINPRLRYTN